MIIMGLSGNLVPKKHELLVNERFPYQSATTGGHAPLSGPAANLSRTQPGETA